MNSEEEGFDQWNLFMDGAAQMEDLDGLLENLNQPILNTPPDIISSLDLVQSAPMSPVNLDHPEPSGSAEVSEAEEEEPPLEVVTPKVANGMFQAKMILATWSQAPDLTKQMIADHLTSLSGTVMRMIVGRESHQDGGVHFHAVVEWERSRSCRPRQFDVNGVHPNVRSHKRGKDSYARSLLRAWGYVSKEDLEPLIFGSPPVETSEKTKRTRDFEEAILLAQTEGVEPAMKRLRETQAFEAVKSYDSIRRGLVAARKASTTSRHEARRIEDFEKLPELPENWRTLYLWGPTGCGKTALARALLPNATVIRHRNQLVGADASMGLIFDDFDVSHWPPTSVIHFTDWEEESGIDVKFGMEVVPPESRKIITMNVPPEQWIPPSANPEQRDAVLRRIQVVYVDNKLF